jgi:hypothetical protein
MLLLSVRQVVQEAEQVESGSTSHDNKEICTP